MRYLCGEEKVVKGVYMVTVSAQCSSCKRSKWIYVPESEWLAWQSGQIIQHAMLSVSEDDRELLISSMCSSCYDAAWQEPVQGVNQVVNQVVN